MLASPEKLKSNIRLALLDQRLRAAVLKATDHSLAKRAEVVSELGAERWEELRERAAALREGVLERLDEHLETLERRAAEKGIRVYHAQDAAAANSIIAEICHESAVKRLRLTEAALRQTGATDTLVGAQKLRIVKSKSMTTEEIGLTPYLERLGYEVVETDLGEYIVQIAGQMPSHITAPALHLSRQDVGKLFAEKLGVEYVEDPTELCSIARRVLREKFLHADVGITGVNFAIAETGTPVMVENEGNGRLVSALPPVQISVMGIEKVIPTWEDVMVLLELLPRSATGQRSTGSVIFFNRPSTADESDGPRELHLVIVDNGRRRALADPQLRSVLRCIRCGACLNACPVYRRVGGHTYGWVYPGPIGAVLAPLFLSLQRAPDHPFASTLCGRCSEICPVMIDLHHHLLELRRRVVRTAPEISGEKAIWKAWQFVMDRPELYRGLAQTPRFLLYDLLHGQWSPQLPIWSQERGAPELARRSFAELFQAEFPGNVV